MLGFFSRMCMVVGALPGLAGCASPRPVRAPAPAPAVQSVARSEITGLIVNGVTSHPLPGAIIDLDGKRRVESGIDGRFRIDAVPVGMYLLATRAPNFRPRIQPVSIVSVVAPDAGDDIGRRNDFIVLLFPPSAYFDGFPLLGDVPPCRTETDCAKGQICLMNNFREMDAPACTAPIPCVTEADCKLGQQCEPARLGSGAELRVCQGRPAPEVRP